MDTLPISLCMIVKNEERHLPACLASVHDWVDEMVILDTGSTDQTVAIARSFGARIFEYTWSGDFAAARNEALSHASNPWILQLDADEEIIADSVPWFYESYPWQGVHGFYLDIRNLRSEEGDEVSLVHRLIRFYRNHPSIRYHSAVHETLHVPGGATFPGGARILHKGYNSAAVREKKRLRNYQILRQRLDESPWDPVTHAYLAQHHLFEEDKQPAITEALTSLRLGISFPMRRLMFHLVGEDAVKREDRQRLQMLLDELMPDAEVYADRHYFEGRLFELTRRPERAMEAYARYLQGEPMTRTAKNESVVSELEVAVRRRLATLLGERGQHAPATDLLQQAIGYTPSAYYLWAELGQQQFKTGAIPAAVHSFRRVVELLKGNPSAEQRDMATRYTQLVAKLEPLVLQ